MNGEVSAEQARKILDMLTKGEALDNVNTSLALRLIPLAEELDDHPKVVIGWDRRPGNAMLVSGLTDGLHSSSVRVIHAGIVATPGLHDAV